MPYILRIAVFVLAAFFIVEIIGEEAVAGQPTDRAKHLSVKHLTLRQKRQALREARRTKLRRHRHAKNSRKELEDHLTDSLTDLKQNRHYPAPGSSGEERNFDWLRKRA